MYTLHGMCQSGNTFKVAFALRAMGLPWQARHVDYFGGATRDADWRSSTNAMGEVPVLEVAADGDGGAGDAKRLTQSGAILTWLAERHSQFGGRNADERYDVLRWLLFDNHKFTSFLATHRFMKSFVATPPDPVVMAFLRGRIDGAFAIVNQHLATQDWLVGDAPTVADFSLSGYLFYPVEETGYEVAQRFPHIQAWVERLKQVPGWADPYDVLPGPRIAPRW